MIIKRITLCLVMLSLGLALFACAPVATDEKSSREVAHDFLINAPTFKYDGISSSLQLVKTTALPDGWDFEYRFDSAHAGYGDRKGQIIAQVITPHTAVITVLKGKVTAAVLDGKWDEVAQKLK